MTTLQILLTILAIAVTTFFTRSIAFFAFSGKKQIPKYILYLGTVLPTAIIGMIVVYCFKGTVVLSSPYALPEIIAGLAVIGLHKWKHNLLISILGGTVLYMLLVQIVF